MKTSMHNKLRDWLITVGQDNGYEAWTPDRNNNVEISKIRNAKVDYRPDIVWKSKRTKEKVFFELIFEEDFRQVIGEKFLRFAFRREEGIVKAHHRPTFIIFDRNLLKNSKEDEIKEKIVRVLRKNNWII